MFVFNLVVASVLAGSALSSGIESSYNILDVDGVFSILEQLDPSSQKTSSHNLHDHDLFKNHGKSLQKQTVHQLGGIYGLVADRGQNPRHPALSHDELGKVLQEIQRAQQARQPRDHVIVTGYTSLKSGNRSTHGGKRFGDKLDLSFDQRRKRNRAEDGGFLEAERRSKKDTGQFENYGRREKVKKGGHFGGKGSQNAHHSNTADSEKEQAVQGKFGYLKGFGMVDDHDLRGFMRGRQRGIGRHGNGPGRSKFGL